ncbi:MAG: outer membrane protein assembly factor BamD, partial [Acidobacteriaceae bacterium]|nr:outer membrane protein assembly factor BamD [Acidobacteriaceae bacterium]
EFVVGNFYWKREMNPAAANRLNALVDQYPLYSNAGEALFEAGDAYSKMGPRFRKQAGDMFSRILEEYPLSSRADDAKRRLQDMEMPIPKADPNALARAKFEQANYHRTGVVSDFTGWLRGGPDVSHAAKSGQPTMTDPKRTIPASVPVVNTETASNTPGTTGGGTTDVSATTVNGSSSLLDKSPDARNRPAATQTASDQSAQQPLPTNRDKELKKYRAQAAKKQAALEKKKKKANKDQGQVTQQGQAQQNQSNATQGAQTPTGAPAAATTPATTPNAPPSQP